MKPLVIYHANCADGFGAAFAAWTVLGDDAEYLPMAYGDVLDTAVVGRTIYILDFSMPREETEALMYHAGRVVWLDHHKTAFEMWCGKMMDRFEPTPGTRTSKENYILLDNNKSGAMLAWEYFHPGEDVPLLIQHIDDYDRWQFKIEGTRAFMKALWSYAPWEFDEWQALLRETHASDDGITSYMTEFRNQGHAILRAHNQNVQAVAKHAREVTVWHEKTIDGRYPEWRGLIVNCPAHLTSDVGHELATRSGTFGLCWHLDEANVVRCSLRSNGDYDVSAIAKVFGGGGHKNAAGFSTDLTTLRSWLGG